MIRATMQEQIAINAKLGEVCKAVNGLCVYAEGWDDARVAAEVNPRLGARHVVYVRSQMGFGKLKPFTNAKDIEELQKFIVSLVQGFENLTKQHTKLTQRVEALEKGVLIQAPLSEPRRV